MNKTQVIVFGDDDDDGCVAISNKNVATKPFYLI